MRVYNKVPILLVLFALIFPAGAGNALAEEKPNIVFIISDDHDNEHLGFMGSEMAQTPNLDRLARTGTVFPVSHLPMSRCHPTLASFLSGRWPHQSGIYYNYGARKLSPENSLPAQLKKAGYASYVEGKYWEGDPREMG
ncbi:MAG: sulfatase-like hydrolase/transferase, partial [Planctomycetota bacterium]|nr:sulfatase-like hydrolase/transferase [Planctomycetota bacterium]